MQTKSVSTPLWLDIKTEYIDENIDRVIAYLRDGTLNVISRDSFYSKTIELFEKRTNALLEELSSTPIYSEPDKEDKLRNDIRILGTFLLIHQDIDQKVLQASAAFLSRLLLLAPNYSQGLSELSVDILTDTLDLSKSDYAFSWSDLLQLEPQVLAHKICTTSHKKTNPSGVRWIEKKGTLCISDGHMDISTMARKGLGYKDQVSSMEILDGKLRFLTSKTDKLKKSDEEDIEKLELFTREFIRSQKDVTPVSKRLKIYSEGDFLTVKVVGKHNGILSLKSTNKDYETVEGILTLEESFMYYKTADFYKYLNVGDRIEVKLEDSQSHLFTVSEAFMNYLIRDYVPNTDKDIVAVIHSIRKDKAGNRKAYMWTDDGFPVMGMARENYSEGDYVEVRVTSYGEDKFFGVINVDIICKADEIGITEDDSKRYCIESYRYEEEIEVPVEHIEYVNEGQLKEVCRMLVACQKSFPSASDRYRMLCAMEIVCNMMGWTKDANYIKFISDYLENVIRFVKGNNERMQRIDPLEEFQHQSSVIRRVDIIDILMAYGKQDQEELLSLALEKDDEQIRKIAALVQSYNNIGGFLSRSMKNVIKREIINALSFEEDGEPDLDKENGIYLGLEDERQEFKTSFFFAPQGAKEQDQKVTIFKGVCAFLNSKNGGTLYLGVDDMGYVKGLETDLEHMEKIAWGNYHGIDGYVRYITDQAKKHFDLSILTHVNISAAYDGKVCAIKVDPYVYNIVELEGNAYIRLNNESVIMNDATRRKIMAERIILNQDDAMVKSNLMDAINNRRQVILHGYSSSNSGDIRDRHVEPFLFASGHDTIWCFDCDDKKNKVFKVDRISNVELCEDGWMYASQHKFLKMDIFRMTGDKPIHVRLQLNMMARNVLLEEYEQAKNVIIPTDDQDVWYLDTDVYKIEGVGRFYMGLANAIKIIDAPELEKYVREYSKRYLLV